MVLKDRKQLAKLMVIQGVSQRQLAAGIGWKSHAYLGRLMRGEVNTMEPDSAVRIAMYLGVGVDDLFVPRSSTDSGRSAPQRRTVRAA